MNLQKGNSLRSQKNTDRGRFFIEIVLMPWNQLKNKESLKYYNTIMENYKRSQTFHVFHVFSIKKIFLYSSLG